MAEDWQNGGFGLYIHWPFCQAKCPYCDFNSHVSRNIDQTAWADAYVLELRRTAERVPNRVLNTVFFGGGTPSLMHPDTVARIMEEVRALWPCANDLETTLEANPGSVEAGRFAGYRDAGVNRISMGIQALNDRDLQRLGRIHSVKEALAAFDIARNCFERVSFDLIYARQDQTPKDWEAELNQALTLAVDHFSLYQLTVEEGTAFGDRYALGKLRGLPDDDTSADMYQITQDVCDAHGMPAYEVSNHARPGAESRHNQIYWRYGDYAGVGPGAHGRLTLNGRRHATEAIRSPGPWLKKVLAGESAEDLTPLDSQEEAAEYLMMGMRLREGLDIDRFTLLNQQAPNAEKLRDLSEMGVISVQDNRITATDAGRAVLNAVIRELLVD